MLAKVVFARPLSVAVYDAFEVLASVVLAEVVLARPLSAAVYNALMVVLA